MEKGNPDNGIVRPDLTVAVVGLGKIGLPIAAQFASHGLRVIGCDIDEALVALINEGEVPFTGEEGLAERVTKAVAARMAAVYRLSDDERRNLAEESSSPWSDSSTTVRRRV